MVSKKEINLDFLVVILYVIITAAFILIPPLNETSTRTILGLPMILILPGYVMVVLLFPRKEDLDGVERVALSFGLSILIVPLIGYTLNFTQWGIRLVPVVMALSFFILFICILAIIRRSLLPEDEKYYVDTKSVASSLKKIVYTNSSPRINQLLSVFLVVLIVASVMSIIYIVVTPNEDETFTEFYIKNKDGLLSGFPSSMKTGDNVVVIVGIKNHEYATTTYNLDIQLENQSMVLPYDLNHVQIAHNQTWEQMIIIEPTYTGKVSELKFLLYKDNNFREPYRDLHLWINVSEVENVN
ncbi:DUF1616 domain-containing protein [Methanolobus sp.]|uniref:DUF1616 domain-containing protein n=1 Tax=Methanolobus sp. TaxID=1874737 RepID=UPI0025F0EC44|nr:DUF1616 domain-containing protein [Methanolobus sp.]